MASLKYNSYKQATLEGAAPNLTTAVVKVLATCDALYTYNAAHDFLDDVSASRYPGTTDQTLTSKTTTNGTFDSADPTFSGVAISGSDNVDVLILYVDTGTPATSRLLAKYDEFTPITPNGNNIQVQVNASGWFSN